MSTAAESIRVLHVDDESAVAELAAEFLERDDERFTVDTATSASDGLDRLTDTDYDCIVSDYDMPGQDGIDFLEAVRERHPDLPFILYTGEGTEAIASEAISAGVTDYLQKEGGTDQYTVLANRVTNAIEQYQFSQRAAQLERLRRVLKDANEALLRAETRSEIEQQICEVICDADPYLFAWFGEHDPDAQTVEPRAAAGIGEGYLDAIEITTDEQATAQGPTGQAVRTQEIVVEQEIAESPKYVPWREAALDRGYQSSAAIPITRDNSVLGVLNVYADHPHAFDDEKQELLTDLAADTGQALDRIERAERLQLYGSAVEAAGHSIYFTDTEGTIEYVNPAFEEMTGYTAEEAVGRNLRILKSGEHDEAFYEELWDTILAGDVWQSELINTTKSGDRYVVDQTIAPVKTESDESDQFVVVNADVTKRKERVQELERYAALFDNATDAIALVEYRDETPVIRDANPAFEALFAGGEEDIVSRDIDEVVVSGDQVAEARAISQQVQEGELVRTNLTRETDDGIRTFDLRVVPVEDSETGEIESTFIIYTDITERLQRQERFQAFVEQSTDIVSVLNPDGTYEYQSPSVERILGYDPEGMTGENAFEYVHPEDRDDVIETFEQAVADPDTIPTVEFRFRHADGSWRWLESRGNNQLENPAVEGFVVNSRDITDRKEYERKLARQTEEFEKLNRQMNEQYRYLFEEAPVMAVVTRAENGTAVIDDCNQLFSETLGYEKEQVIDAQLEDFYTTESQRKLEDGGYDRALAGDFAREDRGLVTAEWDTVETLLRAVPRQNVPEEDGTLAFYVDISKRKQLQRQNDRLDEFAGVVSHDLRNPLNVAEGRLDLAMEDCDSEHLGPVARAHERMESIIDDLLSLARAGEVVGEMEPVELADLVEACWQTVETASAGLVVETETTIQADATRLQQLFENLVRNAVEHGGEDVTITIGNLPDGFYVEDDGPGIPEDERGNVFDAGYSTAKDGTGLGLQIVREVAETHGWEIEVTESSDGGARFEIIGVWMED